MFSSSQLLISFSTLLYSFCISSHTQAASRYLEQDSVIVLTRSEPNPNDDRWKRDCDNYKCFNAIQCEINESKQLLYYVYPPLTILNSYKDILYDTKSMISLEYWRLLHSLSSRSHRITQDPYQACIFVPSIDLVWLRWTNASLLHEIYDNLPYWRFVDDKPGTNHLIITLDPMPNLASLKSVIGRSMLVSSAMDTWTMRTSLDYSIPVTLETHGELERDKIRWKLVFTQYSSISSRQKESIDSLDNKMNGDFLVLGYECRVKDYEDSQLEYLKCDRANSFDRESDKFDKTQCRCTRDELLELRFPRLLSSAQYCLILHIRDTQLLGESSQYLLSHALRRGCVPIISSDFVLPYKGIVKWSKITISLINDYSLDGLETLISSISQETYQQMRAEALETWRIHFNSTTKLLDNLVDHYDSIVYSKAVLNSGCSA